MYGHARLHDMMHSPLQKGFCGKTRMDDYTTFGEVVEYVLLSQYKQALEQTKMYFLKNIRKVTMQPTYAHMKSELVALPPPFDDSWVFT
jgi:hypothetical protein